MERRQTFEAVAELYADVRPGYPVALFDDLAVLTGLGPPSRILEIGCGAGQATRDLAARAQHVVALDPGERLIAAARQRVSAANIDYIVSTFEDFSVAPGAFDLVASAQAWHWVDSRISFSKAAQALAPSGWLAVFGHVPMAYGGSALPALRSAYDTHVPGVWGRPSPQGGYYLPGGMLADIFARSTAFGPVQHRSYAWTWHLDPETFGRYLRTDSGYHVLPENQRFALFDALVAAVAQNGGTLAWSWETHLYAAQKL